MTTIRIDPNQLQRAAVLAQAAVPPLNRSDIVRQALTLGLDQLDGGPVKPRPWPQFLIPVQGVRDGADPVVYFALTPGTYKLDLKLDGLTPYGRGVLMGISAQGCATPEAGDAHIDIGSGRGGLPMAWGTWDIKNLVDYGNVGAAEVMKLRRYTDICHAGTSDWRGAELVIRAPIEGTLRLYALVEIRS